MRCIPAVISILFALNLYAEVAPGHWEGSVKLPLKQARIAVDLVKGNDGQWSGSIMFPDIGNTAAKFDTATIDGASVVLMSKPSMCMLQGKLSADGKSINGEFLSGFLRRVPVPAELRWVSEAAPERTVPASVIAKNLAGDWAGELTPGKSWEGNDPPQPVVLTVHMHVTRGPDGAGSGTCTNVLDKAKVEKISAVAQHGTTIRFEVDGVAGVYVGELKNGEIVGHWSQFDHEPAKLTLRRPANM